MAYHIRLVTRRRIELLASPWKGNVLTAWPTGRMVAAVGFEPTTCRVWTGRSGQLSYAAITSVFADIPATLFDSISRGPRCQAGVFICLDLVSVLCRMNRCSSAVTGKADDHAECVGFFLLPANSQNSSRIFPGEEVFQDQSEGLVPFPWALQQHVYLLKAIAPGAAFWALYNLHLLAADGQVLMDRGSASVWNSA